MGSYPGEYPFSYITRPPGLNWEFSGERQRANRIRHPEVEKKVSSPIL